MTTSELYVSYSSPDDIEESFEIKAMQAQQLLGAQFRFRVIGSSHFITCEALDYAELISCNQPRTGGQVIPLQTGKTQELRVSNGAIEATTTVECQPLSNFDKNRTYDLQYRFAQDAFTTIDVEDDRYVTYHTYPEFDLAVYTETTLSKPVTANENNTENRSVKLAAPEGTPR